MAKIEKQITFSGINLTPYSDISPDGQLSKFQGLERHASSIRPIVLHGTELLSLTENDKFLYIHATSAYKNYIFLSEDENGDRSLRYTTEENPNENKPVYVLPEGTDIKQIQSIGNTLILITGEAMYYILFKESNYKFIGSKVPDIELTFSLKKDNPGVHITDKDITFELNERMYVGEITLGSENTDIMERELLSILNPMLEEDREKGLFYAPFFVRYAYKTSLGDYSYISSPVLMVPNAGAFPYTEATQGIRFSSSLSISGSMTTKDENFEIYITDNSTIMSASKIAFRFNSCKLLAKVMKEQALQTLYDWSDIISSVDIFITHPYSRMGGTNNSIISIHGNPYTHINIPYGGYIDIDQGVYGYSGDYDLSNADLLWMSQIDNEEYRKKMKSDGVFRLINSINLDKINKDEGIGNITPDGFMVIDPGDLNNLDTRETLDTSYDYGSRDTLVPNSALTYNQRLNIWGIKRLPYCPPANLIFTYTNGYIDSNGNAVTDDYQYIIYAFMSDTGRTIKVTSNESKLCNTPSWLFIPHANASKAIIQRTKNGESQYAELLLEEHQFLNGAFYINKMNKTTDYFEITEIQYTDVRPSILDEAFPDFIEEPNKIYTSEIANPFVFPLSGINTIGTGEILGISTVTTPLSQGQFGQFPLMVFCSDGNYSMQVNDEGLYSGIYPMQRDVCINPDSITVTDGSIIYISARGVMSADGNNIQCISQDLSGVPDTFPSETTNPEQLPQSLFLKCVIAYDYSGRRLLFFSTEEAKSYVLSLEDGTWSTGTFPKIKSILNVYPYSYLQFEGEDHILRLDDVYHFSSGKFYEGKLCTRPLKLDSLQLKRLFQFSLEGIFSQPQEIYLYGSNDTIQWSLIGSTTCRRVGSMVGRFFKYYRFAIDTNLSEAENISGIRVVYDIRTESRLR